MRPSSGRQRGDGDRIGDWIIDVATNPRSLGGFLFGVDSTDTVVPHVFTEHVSTEHDVDCIALFRMLEHTDPDARWIAARERAQRLVDQMWQPDDGYFYTGSNDVDTISGVTFSSASKTATGSYNGIPVDQRGVWLEGTSQLACALNGRSHPQDRTRAVHLVQQVEIARTRLGANQHVGGVPVTALIRLGFAPSASNLGPWPASDRVRIGPWGFVTF